MTFQFCLKLSVLQHSFNLDFHYLFVRLAEVKEKIDYFKKAIQRLDMDLVNHRGNMIRVVADYAELRLFIL